METGMITHTEDFYKELFGSYGPSGVWDELMVDGDKHMFSKRHYIVLAHSMFGVRPNTPNDHPHAVQWLKCVTALAVAMKNSNSKFNQEKFIAACLDGGVKSPRQQGAKAHELKRR